PSLFLFFLILIRQPLRFTLFPYTTLFRSPWREKKIANVDYFELLHILEFKKAERVKDCAEILEYKQNRETGERKLYRVWFCKSRLCPMCNWRRAMKHGIQSQK